MLKSGRLAQLVEQLTLNQQVEGSSPSSLTGALHCVAWPRFNHNKQIDLLEVTSCKALCEFVVPDFATSSQTLMALGNPFEMLLRDVDITAIARKLPIHKQKRVQEQNLP